ncbi:hypothetical protein V8E55_002945 [Tylopilus felleus]
MSQNLNGELSPYRDLRGTYKRGLGMSGLTKKIITPVFVFIVTMRFAIAIFSVLALFSAQGFAAILPFNPRVQNVSPIPNTITGSDPTLSTNPGGPIITASDPTLSSNPGSQIITASPPATTHKHHWHGHLP